MIQLNLKYGQNINWALKKFKKMCESEGLFDEFKKRKFFVSNSEKRRLQKQKGIRKALKNKTNV